MSRLLEYIGNHPALVSGTAIVAAIAVAYELFLRSRNAGVSNNQLIALQNKGALILDVRSADEFAAGHIVDARHIALETLSSSLDGLKKYREKPVVVCCESGVRSAQAVKLMQAQGFNQVVNLSGGLASWRQDNLPLNKTTASKSGKKA